MQLNIHLPSSEQMWLRGLAMVALVTIKRGLMRYSRSHIRRSRRSTSAVWQPNTPLQSDIEVDNSFKHYPVITNKVSKVSAWAE